MKIVNYQGSNESRVGERCRVMGHYKSSHQNAKYFRFLPGEEIGLGLSIKYRVQFEDRTFVNVYGRNLHKCLSTAEMCAVFEDCEDCEELSSDDRQIYPYVSVKYLEGHNTTKEYHFLNPYTELRKRDLVVVQTRGAYKTARVCGCWAANDAFRPTPFRAATAMVEHRIDEERMNEIFEKRHQQKEVQHLIDARFRQLVKDLAVEDFMHDPELAHLVQEQKDLE